jgi:UDP-N-acetylglucosamine 2-epimerase (non-hydrolysing)
VVAGTRPEIIKVAPVIEAVDAALGAGTALIIDTGQHYDHAMSGRFWTELGVRPPDVGLRGGGLSRAGCIGYLTAALGEVFEQAGPAAVIVQGDTNSTLAGGLAANASGIPLVHVEAGLRSRDRAMPEEHNRIAVDHLADLCCAATAANAANLEAEGVDPARVSVTGNTIVEAVDRQLPLRIVRLGVLADHRVEPDRFILATIHRPENTNGPDALRAVLGELDQVARRWPVLLALHPRTRLAVERAGARALLERLTVTEPLGSRQFLSLAAHAAVIVSDSGGVAEEATVLKRPLVVVRRSTERPEAIDAGFAQLVNPHEIEQATALLVATQRSTLHRLAITPSPYGDGTASTQIAALTSGLVSGWDRARV